MAAPTRNSVGQLVGILLVTGLLRTACAPGGTAPEDLPGRRLALDSVADTARALAAAEARRTRPLQAGETLDPNTASEEELDRLPGVGPSTAAALVAARDSLPFASVDDVGRVRGVGPSTLARIAPHLALDPAPARALRPGRPPRGAAPRNARGSSPARAPVSLNRAGAEALETLPGVGPVLARRIVEHRERTGGFTRVDDLLEVRGVGPALLEKLRPRVRLR